jgi:UPF0755 protein
MKAYKFGQGRVRRWPKVLLFLLTVSLLAAVAAGIGIRNLYIRNLQPVNVSAREDIIFVVVSGATLDEIAEQLHEQALIKSPWAFTRYIRSNELGDLLKAGTYRLQQAMSVQDIATILSEGKVAVDLFTILPAQRLDQIRETFINAGYSPEQVDEALKPEKYAGHPALVDKPQEANLEGYLYPDSFHKVAETTPETLITASLDEMAEALTPDVRAGIAKQGLSVYQGIILASIVEREVGSINQQTDIEDKKKVAQVFYRRLRESMALQSDATASYGAVLAGEYDKLSYSQVLQFDSPYNTYRNQGLPPTPISNVRSNALQAVADPAPTNFLYFVSGDDGTTHFSYTIEEHEANTAAYCTELCR